MSKILLSLFGVLTIYSCTPENKQPNPSKLKGKVKTVYYTDTITNDTTYRYYLYYDATGFLTSVKDDSITVFAFTKLNDTTLKVIFHYPYEAVTTGYVYLDGNRITSINIGTRYVYPDLGIDTTIYSDLINTIYTTPHLDSVYDFTPSPFIGLGYSTDFKFYDFVFSNDNCISYNISSRYVPMYGPQQNKTGTYTHAYTNIENNQMIPDQIVADGYTTANHLFGYFLGINGYSILPPNKNLVQNISGALFFYYTLTNGKVTSYKISPGRSVRHIEYYE